MKKGRKRELRFMPHLCTYTGLTASPEVGSTWSQHIVLGTFFVGDIGATKLVWKTGEQLTLSYTVSSAAPHPSR